MRKAEIERNTFETQIALRLDIDGSGTGEISTGVGFLDHMLTLFTKHGGFDLNFKTEKIGNFDTQLVHEFWQGFAQNAGMTLHIKLMYGENSHHIAEGIFKAAARVLRTALEKDARFADSIPSTKGVL